MRVRVLALAAALFMASSASAQPTVMPAAAVMLGPSPSPPPSPQEATSRPQAAPEVLTAREVDLSRATISIGQYRNIRGRRTYVSLGSGVVLHRGDVGCVLTARHMFSDPAKGWAPTEVVLRPALLPGRQAEAQGVVVPLVAGQKTLWESPPDGSDLAVLRLPPLSRRSPIYAADPQATDAVRAGALGLERGGILEPMSKALGIVQDCLGGS